MAVLATGCASEVQVHSQHATNPAQPPAAQPAAAPATQLPSHSVGHLDGACGGRPHARKVELAVVACTGRARSDEVRELHRICTQQRDGECHHLTHRALRVWDDTQLEHHQPAAAALCSIREKEELVGQACRGTASQSTLTDLIRQCRGNDATCHAIAKKALFVKNPVLAAQYR